MDEGARVCILCLKIIEKDVLYFPLTNNNAVVQKLNLISLVTLKNLQLTEHPVVCDLCNNKLEQLVSFKEKITKNEAQILCHQSNDANSFLETFSKDFGAICRFCLTPSEDPAKLKTNWKNCHQMLAQCDIHLNGNILKPSKICNICDTTLQTMWKFIVDCSENENHIKSQASKKGILSFKDLLGISLLKNKIAETEKVGEDNNNVSQNQEKGESISANGNDKLMGKACSNKAKNNDAIRNNVVIFAEPSSEADERSDTNISLEKDLDYSSGLSVEICSEVVISAEADSHVGEENDQNVEQEKCSNANPKNANKMANKVENSAALDEESLAFNKTPKTYTRTKPKVHKNSSGVFSVSTLRLSDIQSKPSTSKLKENETMIDQSLNFSELPENLLIDAPPVRNIADITLDITLGSGRLLGTEIAECDKDATNELIYLLEETEEPETKSVEDNDSGNNLQYKNTEELLRVLEDDADSEGVEDEMADKLKKVREKDAVQKSSGIFIKNISVPKKLPKKKVINTLVTKKVPAEIKKTTNKNILKTYVKSSETGKKKHNLRRKTIVTSFREMLNMKPLKKKADCPTENISGANNGIEVVVVQEQGLVKKPHKTSAKSQDNKLDSLEDIQQVNFEKIQIQKISLVGEKNNAKKVPPKRKGRNILKMEKVKKNIPESSVDKVTANITQEVEKTSVVKAGPEVQEVSGVKKKQSKRKTKLENRKEDVPLKRVKKSPSKKVAESIEDVVASPPKTRRLRACKETSKFQETDTNEETETNEEVGSKNNKGTEPESDGSEEPVVGPQSADKPVVVTIIRRIKTKNKAQRDKTWLELTGKSVEEKPMLQEKGDDGPKKRRGRPPLPDSKKKPKKPKPIYYTCTCCPFRTISQTMLIQHQYIHNIVDELVQFKCNQCGFRAASEEIIEQHKMTHVPLDVIYKCMFCEYVNKKKNSTMYHTLRHEDKDVANMFYCLVLNQLTDEEQYECFQCDYQNAEEAVMPDHVMDHQIEKIRNPIMTKFSCKECRYKTKFQNLFQRHQDMHKEKWKKCGTGKKVIKIKKEPGTVSANDEANRDGSQEEDEPVYSCDLCQYNTYNKRSLANHKGLKHVRYAPPDPNSEPRPKKRVPLPDEIYRCYECDYTTQKKPHLSRHVIIHRSKENMEFFECTHCIFETKHRRSYKRHMEMKHKVIV